MANGYALPSPPLSLADADGTAVILHRIVSYADGFTRNSYSIFVGLAVCIVIAVVGYIFAPKGENLTYVPHTHKHTLYLYPLSSERLHDGLERSTLWIWTAGCRGGSGGRGFW
ncbi:hypothetical protein Dda_3219 [Drechslerella dactyloides]|uniref:Uncharacterized protein n=1 Tax=Drechslerella dactyloides TaxID=74499 RepID=A0AAD6J5C6_DREDA|nr:hypothetical protein Dda_3219 [Drechslerella dactyloides]